MRPTTVFALHYARLLSHLIHDPGNQDVHRKTVDELLSASSEPVTLSWDNWQLIVDDEVLPPSLPGVSDVVARMAAHGVRQIAIIARPDPAHVLGAIWILAREPKIGDGGATAVENLSKLGASSVEFLPVSAPIPRLQPRVAPPVDSPAAAPVQRPTPAPSLDGIGLALDDFEISEGARPQRSPAMTPTATDTIERGEGMYRQFTSAVHETPELIIARLRSGGDDARLMRTLESLATVTETALAAKNVATAAKLIAELILTEERTTAPNAKRACTLTLRRLATSSFFSALANDLPNHRELRPTYMPIFSRFAEDGVEALLEQLVYAELAKDRRVLFDAIVELGKGQPMLLRMLTDDRWYVVRNAVELLGEMKAHQAEKAIIDCLRHPEARVRRSATVALTHIGTRTALAAVRDAMRDASAEVRLQVCVALSTQKEAALLPTIVDALDKEEDVEVQRALLTALGRIGTVDAVKRLASFAEPEGRLFRRKSTATRLAAVKALAEARTPDAIGILQDLSNDRDRDVRDAATRGLNGRVTPRGMPAQRAW